MPVLIDYCLLVIPAYRPYPRIFTKREKEVKGGIDTEIGIGITEVKGLTRIMTENVITVGVMKGIGVVIENAEVTIEVESVRGTNVF